MWWALTLEQIWLDDNQISDISAVSGLTYLTALLLDDNQISDISAVSGLTDLTSLYLDNNQIETMDLSGANFPSLLRFSIEGNPLTSVLLTDATLNQASFDALMNGRSSSFIGIAELPGVLNLDMSRVDFAGISDLSTMYTMDDLETLLLSEATNLDGSQVVPLTVELASLDWLDVGGLWGSFDGGTQSSLNAWDALAGNTLVTTVVVYFPDEELELNVRWALGIIHSTPITDTDMQSLGSLDTYFFGITSIDGLEYATNLSRLYLDLTFRTSRCAFL